MDKDIASGSVANNMVAYDLAFKGGALQFVIGDAALGINLNVSISANAVLDAVAKAIPGQVDDAIISVIKSALAL